MCFSLVKLMAVVLNICSNWADLAANVSWTSPENEGNSFSCSTLNAKSTISERRIFHISHLLQPEPHFDATRAFFFWLISVCVPAKATRVRASQAGTTLGKRTVWHFSCMAALSHRRTKPSPCSTDTSAWCQTSVLPHG